MKKQLFLSVFLVYSFSFINAQERMTYKKPPKEIEELIDVTLAPRVAIDSKGEHMLFYYKDRFTSIEQLSEPEMRLAGLRINPKVNINSRTTYYNNIEVGTTTNKDRKQVDNLPEDPLLANFKFSPDENYVAFTNTTETGVELWVLDIIEAKAKKLTDPILNANLGFAMVWQQDSKSLIIKTLPEDRGSVLEKDDQVPAGPTVSVSDGRKAQNRTYQDLLKTPDDEDNFELLAQAELKNVDLEGNTTDFLPKDMYRSISFSPDGNYVLVSTISRPFSYIVPSGRFPIQEVVYDLKGTKVAEVNDVSLTEVLPQGFNATREGRRNLGWRTDKPSTLYWVEALDKGDPEVDVAYRDALYQLEAPFDGEKQFVTKTKNRFSGLTWGNDNYAIVNDRWFSDRNTKTYIFNPSDTTQNPKVLTDRNYQDNYSDPGQYVTTRNDFNRSVLDIQNNKTFRMGAGYTPEGQYPFVDEVDLNSGEGERLYESTYEDEKKKETLSAAIDISEGTVLTRIESKDQYPNYYLRNIKNEGDLKQLTDFENPFKGLEDIHSEVIKYKRNDGLSLEGTLYLPKGYDRQSKEKKPMILWAYPREHKDRKTASQSTSNSNKFVAPNYGSPIFWATQGYVVLDEASFPIIGEEDEEPNDTFREQLIADAEAAINAVDSLGYVDKSRVAVGGHSYGAFMVANLLSHSDLFAGGIARSGAYNRTLTPFGFQNEERNYWEAPEIYNSMSPFMHVDKMDAPLLLIHGAEDNNSGTYPMQSERYFNALKGFGATARLVMLPKESHGYAAKESILHMLWEQDQWLDKYVKHKKEDKDKEDKKE